MVKAINSALVGLAVAATCVHNVAAVSFHDGLNHRDLAGHHHLAERRAFEKFAPRQFLDIPGIGDDDESSTTTGPTGGSGGPSGPTGGNGNGSSTTPSTTPPSTTPSTPTTTDEPSTTSESSSSSSSTTPSNTSTTPTSTSNTANTSTSPGTTLRASNGNSYRNTATLTSLRASTTSSTDDETPASNNSVPFLKNKTAVAATVTVASIVGIGIIIFIVIWLKKKQQRGKMVEEDMWDEAGMQEFSRPQADIASPPPAMLAGGGLGRKNTVLPSQSSGARPTRSISPDPYGDEPDEILAVPPVANYDRPRDSAFDIVPAAPPPAAQYGSALPPPRRDHTSFGSGLGVDPFAGTGFVDATRDSGFGGPGQAGRGAGYNMAPYDQHGNNGAVGMGNQWPQGYNPYNGYSQGGEEAYAANYGGYSGHGNGYAR